MIRQKCVTLSSTEAEYYGLSSAAREAAWLRQLLKELNYQGKDIQPTKIFGDNQSSMALSENPEFHQRTKHVDVQYHYIRQEVGCERVALEFMPTHLMIADGLTKPLTRVKHKRFIELLGLEEFSLENGAPDKPRTIQPTLEGVC